MFLVKLLPNAFKSFSKASLIDQTTPVGRFKLDPSIALFNILITPPYSLGVILLLPISAIVFTNKFKGSPVSVKYFSTAFTSRSPTPGPYEGISGNIALLFSKSSLAYFCVASKPITLGLPIASANVSNALYLLPITAALSLNTLAA